MTSRTQMPLVRGISHSENLTFSALLCEQMSNEKRASDDETKKHSRENSGSDSKRQKFTNKTVIATEATTFCNQPLTHYLPRSALKTCET